MITTGELRDIFLMDRLDDAGLESLLPIIQEEFLADKEMIFEQDSPAEIFYMLKKGKVLLRVDISPTTTISLGSIKPGYSFGWSSLMADMVYTSHAVCVGPCEVYRLGGRQFMEMLEANHTMGFNVLKGVMNIMENRLKRRTDQLMKTMRKQMEIWDVS